MNNNFLNQVTQFIKLALDNSDELQEELFEYKKQAAAEELNKEKYRLALQKAADALYDTDFITDDVEKRTFLRKAAEDPIYVVRTLEKVAEQADVAQIGRPAKLKARSKEAEMEENDPVYQAAFGVAYNSGIIDE